MPTITPRSNDSTLFAKTQPDNKKQIPGDWWNANNKKEMCSKLLGTIEFLKDLNQFRYRQASLYTRMYGNLPLFGWVGSNLSRLSTANQLPIDRPTMSVITSGIDTLVARITQVQPRPVFLTDRGDYKKRMLSKKMNTFIWGEFYQTKAYRMMTTIFRDACVLGTGVIKILEDQENKVCLERRLIVDLLMDPNDSFYGEPRQLYELKLIDRSVLMEMFPKYRSEIEKAEQGYPDSSGQGNKTVSDLVMVGEGWHLPSGPDANDGYHIMACSEGIIFEEKWEKKTFPFCFFKYSPQMVGPYGQGICEQLMGTQVEINKLLMTVSNAINVVGVPRIFVEEGSKVVKSHLNNAVGSIITFRGTRPEYVVAPCVPAEMYDQLQRLINYGYQQIGISQLSASSQKPAGLTSGTALREYDDLQTDRFATISKCYENLAIDLSHRIIEKAIDIAKRTGKYQTVYPEKSGTETIDLPEASKINEDPFVIQCYASSSLPKDPAGRRQEVTEWMQAGLVTPEEGRRLLDFPDTDQNTQLAIAAEERLYMILDKIVEEGEYTPPDPFTYPLADKIVVQYYNRYAQLKLEEEKLQLLRNFFIQFQAIQMQGMSQAMNQNQGPPSPPMANPIPQPSSELINNVPQAA